MLAVAVLLVLTIGSLGARTLSHVPANPVVGLAALLLTLLVFAGAGLTALACERAEQPEPRLWTRLHNVYVLCVLPGVLLLSGVRVYATAIYPTLPWEFGGMRPRPAYLDVTRALLSIETRRALLAGSVALPADPGKDAMAVARSRRLDVVYESADMLMVRLQGEPHGADVYAVRKSAVQSILWCDDRAQ